MNSLGVFMRQGNVIPTSKVESISYHNDHVLYEKILDIREPNKKNYR